MILNPSTLKFNIDVVTRIVIYPLMKRKTLKITFSALLLIASKKRFWHQKGFSLANFTKVECRAHYQFEKQDIPQLAVAFKMPLFQRTRNA